MPNGPVMSAGKSRRFIVTMTSARPRMAAANVDGGGRGVHFGGTSGDHSANVQWRRGEQPELAGVPANHTGAGVRAGKQNWFQEKESAPPERQLGFTGESGSRPRPTVRGYNSSLLSAICSLNCDPSKLIHIRPNSSQSISLPSITRSGTRPPRSSSHSIRPRTTA